jgi:hypothetical protein
MPPSTEMSEAFHEALLETRDAINDCRNKRLSGELINYFASVRCSNPSIIAAFARAGFRNMDLIYKFASDRSLVAQRIDNGTLKEDDGNKIIRGILTYIVLQEKEGR